MANKFPSTEVVVGLSTVDVLKVENKDGAEDELTPVEGIAVIVTELPVPKIDGFVVVGADETKFESENLRKNYVKFQKILFNQKI